ncbi:SDR family NAD(P)-dependent oxidoreductase [Flavihumibacter petaseus]|uniref:Putative oxidoreductase n=1 Tax=Flavihumibacter petaseus NBRC 106054 TaxID=1220578 RepID=A0A0E9N0S1_9BACT|nr:SDR family NAD(P)-dependent oxidoreductase [Flavihumibacter petaseus]GAO43246.1 putative oxidoreductase [Flavihumibacter petaseus NBRC 106054]
MKRVLISGANGALGSITTQYFLDKGYAVIAIVSDINSRSHLPEHPNLEIAAVDLREEKATATLITELVTRNNKIDGALLLAGGFAAGGLESISGDAIQEQLQLNFMTAFHVARPVFSHFLLNGSGRLVLIGARPALLPSAGKDMMAYALSKSLLFNFAEQLNATAKGKDITATVLVPSTIDTPANRKSMPDADAAKWVDPVKLAAIMEWLFSAPADVLRETVLKVYNNA